MCVHTVNLLLLQAKDYMYMLGVCSWKACSMFDVLHACKSLASWASVCEFHAHMHLAGATLWAIIKQDCGRVAENNITLTH